MGDVAKNLERMGPEQYVFVLAFVFLGSYAFALGGVVGARGRWVAVATALLAAAGFSALGDPWEGGVMLTAFALVGMGMVSGAVWTLWAVAAWCDHHAARVEVESIGRVPELGAARSFLARLRASLRSI